MADGVPAIRDEALIGGPERREIVLVPYDPAWPSGFEAERARIEAALGPRALRIEHIGSTAVPGLVAKPILDVLLVVADVEDEDAYLTPLAVAGFVLRVREPGHRMLRTRTLNVHLHLWSDGDPAVDRHLRFRDRLRASDEDRDRYAAVKRELASHEWPTMNHYADAKTEVIRQILGTGGTGGTGGMATDETCGRLLHSEGVADERQGGFQLAAAEAFQPFLGEWETTGEHGLIPDTVLHGRAVLDRLPPGGFLRIRSSIREDVGIPAGVEVFGTDGDSGRAVMLHHDERGVTRIYDAAIEGRVLRWWRDAVGFRQRSTLTVAPDGRTMVGRGELCRDDTTWEQDLDLTYTRVGP